VAVGELLFELAGEALLDFVEAGKEGDGDEDYDGFFAVADFDLEEEMGMLVGEDWLGSGPS
jgi:hypothetical protein